MTIILNTGEPIHLTGDAAQRALNGLREEIRAREHWFDRVEPWECYAPASTVSGGEAMVYSFAKEMRILNSRMTSQERAELG